MKKTSLLFLILSLCIGASASESELSIGLTSMSMDYREYYPDILDSEKTDTLPGFTLEYTTRISDGLNGKGGFLDIALSHYEGDTTYVGQDLNDPNAQYGDLVLTTQNTISEGSVGYSEMTDFGNFLLLTRLGIGYRSWERALADGHSEEYKWPYGSIKFGALADMTYEDTLGIFAEYHKAFSPKMESNRYGTFDLGSTKGFSLSIPWEHAFTPEWAFKLTYTYQTWDIDQSNIVSGMLEPRSESYFNIFNAALVYRY